MILKNFVISRLAKFLVNKIKGDNYNNNIFYLLRKLRYMLFSRRVRKRYPLEIYFGTYRENIRIFGSDN